MSNGAIYDTNTFAALSVVIALVHLLLYAGYWALGG